MKSLGNNDRLPVSECEQTLLHKCVLIISWSKETVLHSQANDGQPKTQLVVASVLGNPILNISSEYNCPETIVPSITTLS